MEQATRFPWSHFPAVFIHAPESFIKTHHAYAAAKSGDSLAAMELVIEAVSSKTLDQLWKRFNDLAPILVSAHAEEAFGVNAIPDTVAWLISDVLNWPRERRIFQANKVGHTGATGYERLQRQALFAGPSVILTGKDYSAELALTSAKLSELRRKHGHIEYWWRQRFGFGFECLTASEARYLSQTATAERIIKGLEAVGG